MNMATANAGMVSYQQGLAGGTLGPCVVFFADRGINETIHLSNVLVAAIPLSN